MPGLEARVHGARAAETPREQSGAGQQHQRQRHLRDTSIRRARCRCAEPVARVLPPSATRQASSARPERRQRAHHERGEGRDRDGKRHDRAVQADVAQSRNGRAHRERLQQPDAGARHAQPEHAADGGQSTPPRQRNRPSVPAVRPRAPAARRTHAGVPRRGPGTDWRRSRRRSAAARPPIRARSRECGTRCPR